MKKKLLCLTLFLSHFAQAQSIKNADFETGSAIYWQFNTPANFDASQKPGYTFSIIKDPTKHNSYVGHFKSTVNSQWCQIKQQILYKPTDSLEKIRISATMRFQGSDSSIAGISARAEQDSKSRVISQKTLFSNTGWTKVYYDLVVTNQAYSLSIFCTLQGKGEAWFDDIKIEKIDITKTEQSIGAKYYLDTAIAIIERNALYKDSVDFKSIVRYAKIIASESNLPSDCYGAIKYVLLGLKDHHSFFQTPKEANYLNRPNDTSMLLPFGKRINGNIGYLKIPSCMAVNKKLVLLYADSLQRIIKSIDNKNINSWIVDNRDNTGGNCWPMLLGLGPVLGEGVFNRKKANGISTDSISYQNGEIRNKDSVIIKTGAAYKLYNPFPKVALLMNRMSASSGEVVIVSFKNRPKTKLFGEASYGLSTVNEDFKLKDGAMIFVCSAKQTDRLGNVYGGKLYPDVLINDSKSTPNDEVIAIAINWLKINK